MPMTADRPAMAGTAADSVPGGAAAGDGDTARSPGQRALSGGGWEGRPPGPALYAAIADAGSLARFGGQIEAVDPAGGPRGPGPRLRGAAGGRGPPPPTPRAGPRRGGARAGGGVGVL